MTDQHHDQQRGPGERGTAERRPVAVAPGIVRTDIHARESGDPDRLGRVAPLVPMRRPAEPDEIAAPIAWLLSPEASYVTGAILRVSGGT